MISKSIDRLLHKKIQVVNNLQELSPERQHHIRTSMWVLYVKLRQIEKHPNVLAASKELKERRLKSLAEIEEQYPDFVEHFASHYENRIGDFK